MRGAVAVLFMTNVIATRAFLAASRQAGVGRFVLVSSFGVYGTAHLQPHATLDEACPLDPQPHLRDGYSHSKIVQEHAAWQAHRGAGLPLVVVRPSVIYGPGRDWITTRVGLRLGNVLIKMGGRQRVPYTYVENCADAICRAGIVPGIEGQAFNVVDDDLPTANALVRRYHREVSRLRVVPVPGWVIPALSSLSEWYHNYSEGQLPAVLSSYRSQAQWKPLRYSNAKAKQGLGWTPATSFDEGLGKTARVLLQQRPSAAGAR
jgi:nucleoside-diphosphate-sugar epimerase